MNRKYVEILDDTRCEIYEIRKWINSDKNKFDSKTRYLISYSVIKASGTIEVVFKHLIFDFLSMGTQEDTKNYLEKMIVESSCNPNVGNMSNMLQSISNERRDIFDAKVKESGYKPQINSLVQLRNDFAHGDSINVSIDTVITYFEASVEVLKILENVLW